MSHIHWSLPLVSIDSHGHFLRCKSIWVLFITALSAECNETDLQASSPIVGSTGFEADVDPSDGFESSTGAVVSEPSSERGQPMGSGSETASETLSSGSGTSTGSLESSETGTSAPPDEPTVWSPPLPRPTGTLPEVRVTPAAIIDFEFDWGRDGVYCPDCNFGDGNNRLTFTDHTHNLWIAHVDPVTGDFVPATGLGQHLDTGAAFAKNFGNGPEWVFAGAGSMITYTKYYPGEPENFFAGSIGLAAQTADGWTAQVVENGREKQSPMGTLDIGDAKPRLSYQALGKVYWRFIGEPHTEIQVQLGNKGGGSSRRWVDGTPLLIYTSGAEPNDEGVSYQQVYTYDTETGVTEQLTFDEIDKNGAFMWKAPEFDDDWVFFTIYGRTDLAVYRQIQGSSTWSLINVIPMPSEVPYIWSPEVFVYKGRSWIFTQVSASSAAIDFSAANHIAMTGIDPEQPNFRMLTNNFEVKRVRSDPEYYITENGPYIYYNRYVPKTETDPGLNDGVWRVDTYLGPL